MLAKNVLGRCGMMSVVLLMVIGILLAFNPMSISVCANHPADGLCQFVNNVCTRDIARDSIVFAILDQPILIKTQLVFCDSMVDFDSRLVLVDWLSWRDFLFSCFSCCQFQQ